MGESANCPFPVKKERNRVINRTRREGGLVKNVQVFPGEMLENVKRINRTLTILKIPHKGKSGQARPWGYADTLSYIIELGAPYIIQSPEYQRLEREAEAVSRADKQEGAILDAIIDKHGL